MMKQLLTHQTLLNPIYLNEEARPANYHIKCAVFDEGGILKVFIRVTSNLDYTDVYNGEDVMRMFLGRSPSGDLSVLADL